MKPIKAYIAAPFQERERAIRIMRLLEMRGIEITSTWLRSPDQLADEFARLDLADVARSDVLIALNPDGWAARGTGGRHVEFGYALALQKPIILVGERTNIFHYLDLVEVIDDTEDVANQVTKAAERVLTPPNMDDGSAIDSAIEWVRREVMRAEALHKPFNSPHEGYAVIQEEVDELWDEVKANRGRTHPALVEAVQVAAMGVRYVANLSVKRPATVSA